MTIRKLCGLTRNWSVLSCGVGGMTASNQGGRVGGQGVKCPHVLNPPNRT